MIDYKDINAELSRQYGVSVPEYNLSGVLDLLSGVEPTTMADTAAECIIMIADSLLMGTRINNARTQEMMSTLKAIYRVFSAIKYDVKKFDSTLERQIVNGEGIYAEEPDLDYPLMQPRSNDRNQA